MLSVKLFQSVGQSASQSVCLSFCLSVCLSVFLSALRSIGSLVDRLISTYISRRSLLKIKPFSHLHKYLAPSVIWTDYRITHSSEITWRQHTTHGQIDRAYWPIRARAFVKLSYNNQSITLENFVTVLISIKKGDGCFFVVLYCLY